MAVQMQTVYTVAFTSLAADDEGQIFHGTAVFQKSADAQEHVKTITQDVANFWQVPMIAQVVEMSNGIGRFTRLWEVEPNGPRSDPKLLRLLAQIRHDEVKFEVSRIILPTGIKK